MRNALLFVLLAASALGLTGCGEIDSHLAYQQIAVEVTHNGQPARGRAVGVAIRSHRDKPYTVQQPVATNSRGVALAEFPVTWTNSKFTLPTKRTVPPTAPEPLYIVATGGQKFFIGPKSPNTTYRWNGERWETRTTVEVP